MFEGKLFVIDGTDGCGKETQVAKLEETLKDSGYKVMTVSFPNYDSETGQLIQSLNEGKLNINPIDLNPYVASGMYALDRYVSYETGDWKKFLEEGGIVIMDRYVSSNIIHQATKFESRAERGKLINWIYDLEYKKFNLPKPDVTVFLDVKPRVSKELLKNRGDNDLVEKNYEYQEQCYDRAKEIAVISNWVVINCNTSNGIKSIDAIHRLINNAVLDLL